MRETPNAVPAKIAEAVDHIMALVDTLTVSLASPVSSYRERTDARQRVRDALLAAFQSEREACADLASSLIGKDCTCELGQGFQPTCLAHNAACSQIEAAIRGRANAE